MRKENKWAATAAKDRGRTVFSAYWTTMEVGEKTVTLRFRFPMKFGMLRAVEWAEKEMGEAADWLAQYGVMGPADRRTRFVMPWHHGKRKCMHRSRSMELTIGMGAYQIEMTVDKGSDPIATASYIDDAIECMARWMRENAYIMQLQ